MRYLTHLDNTYLYTANWYDYTMDTGGQNRVYSSAPGGTINFSGGQGMGSSGLVIYSPTPLEPFIRVDTMKDATGELLFPSGFQGEVGVVYEVRSVMPMMNVLGAKYGYRMNLVGLGV